MSKLKGHYTELYGKVLQLESCDYENQAGLLNLNVKFQELKKTLEIYSMLELSDREGIKNKEEEKK